MTPREILATRAAIVRLNSDVAHPSYRQLGYRVPAGNAKQRKQAFRRWLLEQYRLEKILNLKS